MSTLTKVIDMELRDYIEEGIAKAGSVKGLATRLEQHSTTIANAKAHQRGLPNYACIMLADFIGQPRINVIAASEMVTEKDEKKRAVWLPFVLGASRQAASDAPQNSAKAGHKAIAATIAALVLTSGAISYSPESTANDTLNVSTCRGNVTAERTEGGTDRGNTNYAKLWIRELKRGIGLNKGLNASFPRLPCILDVFPYNARFVVQRARSSAG